MGAARFDIPVYGGRCAVHRTHEAFNDDRADRFGWAPITRPAAGRTSHITHPNGAIEFIVAWCDGRTSTLAHEMGHVAIIVLTRAGISIAGEDGEPFCHLLGALMKEAGVP